MGIIILCCRFYVIEGKKKNSVTLDPLDKHQRGVKVSTVKVPFGVVNEGLFLKTMFKA